MANEWAREKADDVMNAWGADETGLRNLIAAALDAARAEGAEDRTVQIIAALEDLSLRPQDGGPVYYATYEFGGEVKTVALQPQQIEPVFRALRDAVGGYEKLQEWRMRVRSEGERIGAERERWECYAAASLAFAQFRGGSPAGIEQRVCEALAARGPMRGPEEE